MSVVKVHNLSSSEVQSLFSTVQSNCGKSYAVQRSKDTLYINTDTVLAKSEPQEKWCDVSGYPVQDYSQFTFTIQSNYWSEPTLREFAGL